MNAEQWNEQYKIGVRVAAYPCGRDDAKLTTRTRSEAWTLGDTDVVKVVGYKGRISLSLVDVIEHTPMTADDIAAQALSDAGAFCGQCGFEPGDRGCPDCERVWANYVAVLRATDWAPRAEVVAARDAEIVAWLVKKAREVRATPKSKQESPADTLARMASKIQRGAVRPNNLRMLPATPVTEPDLYAAFLAAVEGFRSTACAESWSQQFAQHLLTELAPHIQGDQR
ncbi:hypothetical protein OG539_32545 [Actinacidiphila glaucinigra]|uniref:hypothetical protein n=1 Tax=Actinacidiphila glaucinigra TaxID=235986 RepID=UPI003249CF5C